ncbi:DUF1642 domain-containing protein [Lactococcus cremoris]|uniref:DUF1642 domain-containing protein n=1 Tax=Lactococcus lactis subsp. cremoris TaxID=1359 RepID=UPI00038B715E|nr:MULTISPECIES: DUF1642 domain-containing protein [Lactococcus]EQC56551.1 hypothetical protein LLT5_07600 [Lactococcus cremoris subsp. cremoris TIFN5]EQC83894.1 hypothetical protein LLT1_03640 [Lactococcus cremoris subsp. cremoris TIFN1]QGJ84441.1 hypothetical protein [Lactococcus phage proPhi1]QGJ84601.1 hypothetical protein [Lactococcus phage proPhi5]AXN65087.1 phage-encoded protein [Lactococcus cremoris]
MTKFEEELFNKVKVTNIELTTEAEYKKSTLINHFKNWHSDEEFQELFDKYSNLNDNYEKEVIKSSKLESQIIVLKSQLQQQALPVVPECVADAIAWDEQIDNSIAETLKDIFTSNDKDLIEAGLWVKNNPEKYIIARNIGYTVEKPQLFYIDLPKVFGLSDSTFVSKAESGIISEFTKGKDYALKLTEQEIKSIDERYWQFAVPVEEEK